MITLSKKYYLLWCLVIKWFLCTSLLGQFSLSIVRYEDYNRVITECTFNASEPFYGFLQYKVNNRTPISFSRAETHNSGCATVTLETDLRNASKNWNISVVLQGCDQVQVRCGNKRRDCSYDLSSPVILKGKEACCTKLSYSMCHFTATASGLHYSHCQ